MKDGSMLDRFPIILALMVSALLTADPVSGQNVTVQQPVVDTIRVGTTVIVPDRGAALLGGVNRAADFRSESGFGPFKSRSGIGSERSSQKIWATARIHDFDEMDRMIIDEATRSQPFGGAAMDGNAGAYRRNFSGPVYSDIYRGRMRNAAPQYRSTRYPGHQSVADRYQPYNEYQYRTEPAISPIGPAKQPNGGVLGQKYFKLGQEAESRGLPGVAKLHYKLASKHGSTEAAERLQALSVRTP